MTTSVVIGRFQPFHNGHLDLIVEAFKRSPKNVTVIIGSIQESRTMRNPFTFDERVRMIRDSLSETEQRCVDFIGIRDYNDDDRWRAQVVKEVCGANPSNTKYFLIGNNKDASTYYLGMFANWEFIQVDPKHEFSATDIRKNYFIEQWQSMVPPSTVGVLNTFDGTHEYWKLQGEYVNDEAHSQKG